MILFADGLALVIISRFVAGISIGGEYTAIFAAVDEFVPASYRGRVDIIIDGSWHIGGITASLLSLVMNTQDRWKWMFGLGLIGLLPLVILRRYIPESPRWLMTKHRDR
jgi:MFS family permease